MATLVSGVRRTKRRPKADHIHLWIFATDNATLQAGVNYLYIVVIAKKLLVDLSHQLYNLALHIRLPSRVIAIKFDLQVGH